MPKTVNPIWNYDASFVIETFQSQTLKIEAFDHDNSSSDDFLGIKEVQLSTLVDHKTFSDWLTLDEVKHGELLLKSRWKGAW